LSKDEGLFYKLIDQRNIEYSIFRIFQLKARREEDPVSKAVYEKICNDSLVHRVIIERAIRALGREVTEPVMLRVLNYNSATMGKEEASMEEVEDALEELEAISARYLIIMAERFPDPSFLRLFRRIHYDGEINRSLLKDLRARREILKAR